MVWLLFTFDSFDKSYVAVVSSSVVLALVTCFVFSSMPPIGITSSTFCYNLNHFSPSVTLLSLMSLIGITYYLVSFPLMHPIRNTLTFISWTIPWSGNYYEVFWEWLTWQYNILRLGFPIIIMIRPHLFLCILLKQNVFFYSLNVLCCIWPPMLWLWSKMCSFIVECVLIFLLLLFILDTLESFLRTVAPMMHQEYFLLFTEQSLDYILCWAKSNLFYTDACLTHHH